MVVYSRHFVEELLNDDLDMEDVLRVCKSGAIADSPESDIKTGEWKYRIGGITAEQRLVTVVFVLKTNKAVVITVFERKS
ncbi:MAG: DUF4258 domain-containing protein [Bryobacteraceae bacterium]